MAKAKEIKDSKLKVLVLEDSIRDFELIREQLLDAGYNLDVTHVDSQDVYTSLVSENRFDIILSDFSLPGFDAFMALEISRKVCPDVPFICFSGSIGEETAIELLKLGAVDYVLKDRPERLPFAFQRALNEAKEKAAHLKASKALAESENRFKQVAEDALEWIWEVDRDGLYTYASPVVDSLLGYKAEEVVGKKHFYDFFLPEFKDELKKDILEGFSARVSFKNFENTNIHRDGHFIILSTSGSPFYDEAGNFKGYRGVDSDISERKRAEKALVESEEKFRSMFHNHSAVKLIINPETGDIVDANNAASEFYGWSADELGSMKISQISISIDEKLIFGMQNEASDQNIHFECQQYRKDKSIADVEVFCSQIQYGNKKHLHSIIHDVSEKKKAEEQIKLLGRAVEQSSLSIIITDNQGNIKYVNPYTLELTGYTSNELIGKNPGILKSGLHSREFFEHFWKTILSGKVWEGEFLNKKKTGEIYCGKAVVSPIFNEKGEITHFVSVKEDITEKKKLLEDLIAAKLKAEESDRLKTAFINNISHEIRTPLNGILGFGQLLTEMDIPKDERKRFFYNLEKCSDRLLQTVSDYLDIAMIVSGQVKCQAEEFYLRLLINDSKNLMAGLCREKQLEYEIDVPPAVYEVVLHSDPDLVFKTIKILAGNAVKFTTQGKITIGVNDLGDKLEFFVRDTGKGIAKDKLQEIFDIFTQDDTSITRGYEGSGLGLAIAQGYVKLIGGSLSVKSELGKGSTFSFTVPHY